MPIIRLFIAINITYSQKQCNLKLIWSRRRWGVTMGLYIGGELSKYFSCFTMKYKQLTGGIFMEDCIP